MPDPDFYGHQSEMQSDVPCELEIVRYAEMHGAVWRALPWRVRLAWRLRNLANRIDRRLTYTVDGIMPASTSQADLWDAMAFGTDAAAQYLIDLSRDRRVELPVASDDEA